MPRRWRIIYARNKIIIYERAKLRTLIIYRTSYCCETRNVNCSTVNFVARMLQFNDVRLLLNIFLNNLMVLKLITLCSI